MGKAFDNGRRLLVLGVNQPVGQELVHRGEGQARDWPFKSVALNNFQKRKQKLYRAHLRQVSDSIKFCLELVKELNLRILVNLLIVRIPSIRLLQIASQRRTDDRHLAEDDVLATGDTHFTLFFCRFLFFFSLRQSKSDSKMG